MISGYNFSNVSITPTVCARYSARLLCMYYIIEFLQQLYVVGVVMLLSEFAVKEMAL